MPATKVGASIYVNGSPNTMSSITSDINDITWIEEAPAGTFTIKSKILDIRSGGVATLGNSGDYSIVEKLVLTPATNDTCRIDIQKGGEFQMFGASELDGNSATPLYYQRWRWYGKFHCRGNATYTPYIYHLYIIWKYRASFIGDGDDRNHDIMDIDYLKVDTPWSAATKWTQPTTGRVFADYGVENIKHATFGKLGDPAWRVCETTQAQARQCGDDASKITWEDCIFYGMGTAFYLNPYHFHFKNCQFLQSTSFAIAISQPFTPGGIARTEEALYRDLTVPLYVFLEGCTFTPVYVHDIQVANGGGLLVKDCTLNGATYNIQCLDGGRVLIWTGNTFNGSVPLYVNGSNSMLFYVHALDLTIQDKGGSPIEDALIYIRQKDGREMWTFRTDSNGKPISMAALQGKIMLVHKEQLDNVPNYTIWSDAGNSTYHDIWILAAGYEPCHAQQIMSADRNQIISLEDALTAPDVRDSVNFGLGLVGELDLPVIGDVEKGVQYDSVTKTGTFKAPAEADVRDGEGYGAGDVEFTGELDLPAIGNVEKGVQYDNLTKTGTFKAPVEVDVRDGEGYGAGDVEFTGALDLPAIGDVEKGVQFDSATKTGTFKVPAEADVRDGEGYGAADVEFTGELDLPVIGDVRDGIKYDSETKEGELDLPAVGDVEKGVQFDKLTKTGTFKVPIENDVRKNKQYGKDDVEFTGKTIVPGKADVRKDVNVDVSDKGLLDLPAIGDVEKDVQFDNLTKTGTFKVPTEPQVQKDVQYGAAGTEFTGTMVRRVVWRADAVGQLQKTVSIKGIFQEGG